MTSRIFVSRAMLPSVSVRRTLLSPSASFSGAAGRMTLRGSASRTPNISRPTIGSSAAIRTLSSYSSSPSANHSMLFPSSLSSWRDAATTDRIGSVHNDVVNEGRCFSTTNEGNMPNPAPASETRMDSRDNETNDDNPPNAPDSPFDSNPSLPPQPTNNNKYPIENRRRVEEALFELGVTNTKVRAERNMMPRASTAATATASASKPRRKRKTQPRDSHYPGRGDGWASRRRRRAAPGGAIFPCSYNRNSAAVNDVPVDGEWAVNDEISARLRVKSVHAAQTIDVVAVLSKVFGTAGGGGGVSSKSALMGSTPPLRHVFGRNSVVVQLAPPKQQQQPSPSSPSSSSIATTNITAVRAASLANQNTSVEQSGNKRNINQEKEKKSIVGHVIDEKRNAISMTSSSSSASSPSSNMYSPYNSSRYVAVFRFGSVVFFNISPKEAGKILEEIKKYSTDPISAGFERKEHFEVAIQPGMEDPAHVDGDCATVKELDMNNVAVISNIMAQTVALDTYSDTVDELLANFASINSTVTKTGKFTHMERDSLFKVVAQNNSIFIDMISKLAIKERSDTAWNLSQYESVHEGMREEFEIDKRFQQIEFKLNLIQQNAKFFVEILHSQKTNSLEWIIIVLILFECILMCLEMSGLGGVVFGALPMDMFRPS